MSLIEIVSEGFPTYSDTDWKYVNYFVWYKIF